MPGPRPIISLLGHPPHCHPPSKIYKSKCDQITWHLKTSELSIARNTKPKPLSLKPMTPGYVPESQRLQPHLLLTSCPTFRILLHSMPTLCVLFLLIRRPVSQPLSAQTSTQASLKAQLTQFTSSGKLSRFPSRHALHLTPRHQPYLSVCLFTDWSSPSML